MYLLKSLGAFKMIQVFCKEKGSGKTKALMSLANSKVNNSKGNLVYIDDDTRGLLRIHKDIRFICSKDFNIHNYKDFYGFIWRESLVSKRKASEMRFAIRGG